LWYRATMMRRTFSISGDHVTGRPIECRLPTKADGHLRIKEVDIRSVFDLIAT